MIKVEPENAVADNIQRILEYVKENILHVKMTTFEELQVTWVWSIAKILDNLDIKVFGSNLKDMGDIQKRVYEGGFKVWECELDGLSFIFNSNELKTSLKDAKVLEIGCGAGLLGIGALECGASLAYFHDYNKEVLFYHTMINILVSKKGDIIRFKRKMFFQLRRLEQSQ